MRTLFLAALAALSLYTGALHTTRAVLDTSFDRLWIALTKPKLTQLEVYQINRIRFRVWSDLCMEYRKVSCAGMPVPQVEVFLPNPVRPGLMGFYDGSDTVYVKKDLRGYELEEVLAHEMSHYWDVQAKWTRVPGPAREVCFSEKRAWAVSDKVNAKYGRDLIGSKWVQWYFHCTPYVDELYPS